MLLSLSVKKCSVLVVVHDGSMRVLIFFSLLTAVVTTVCPGGIRSSICLPMEKGGVDCSSVHSKDPNFDAGGLQQCVDQLLGVDAEVQKKSALFLFGLKEKRCLSQTAVNDIVTACKDLFKHSVSRVQ